MNVEQFMARGLKAQKAVDRVIADRAKAAAPLEFRVVWSVCGYVATCDAHPGNKSPTAASPQMACEYLARQILGPNQPRKFKRVHKGWYVEVRP